MQIISPVHASKHARATSSLTIQLDCVLSNALKILTFLAITECATSPALT